MLKKKIVFLISSSIIFSCSKTENSSGYKKILYDNYNDYEKKTQLDDQKHNRKDTKNTDKEKSEDDPNFSIDNYLIKLKKYASLIFQDIYPHKKNVDTVSLLSYVNNSNNIDDLNYNLKRLFDSQNDLHTMYLSERDCQKYGLPSNILEVSSVIDNAKEYFIISKINFTNNYEIDKILQSFQIGDRIVSVNDESPQQRIVNIVSNNRGANVAAKKSRALENFFQSTVLMSYRVVIFRNGQFLNINIPKIYFTIQACLQKVDNEIKNDDIYEVNSFNDFAYIKLKTFLYDTSDDDFESLKNIFDKLKYNILSQNKNKLIIDVRNNQGGNVELSDILSYLFYDPRLNKPFFPMHYRLKASYFNLSTMHDKNKIKPKQYNYDLLIDSLHKAIGNNKEYSESFPITSTELLNNFEPTFFTTFAGKEIYILTNSKCYSACDSFVAVLKDQNLITKVVGEDAQTGGGGASIFVLHNMPESISKNFYFQTSFMQMQSKTENGFRLIEGEGIYADCVFPKSFSDFTTQNYIINDQNYIKRVIQKLNNNECR